MGKKILNTKTRLNSHGYSASFSCLRLFPHLLVKFQNSFYACVVEGCSASLTIACEKQTSNLFHLRWSSVENRVSRDVLTGKVHFIERLFECILEVIYKIRVRSLSVYKDTRAKYSFIFDLLDLFPWHTQTKMFTQTFQNCPRLPKFSPRPTKM